MEANKEFQKVLEEHGLKKKTKIVIEIDTRFNKVTGKDLGDEDDDSDFTENVEDDFHRAIYDYIEKHLTEDDDIESDILQDMGEYDDWLPKKVKEFNDLGEISIRIYEDKTDTSSLVESNK